MYLVGDPGRYGQAEKYIQHSSQGARGSAAECTRAQLGKTRVRFLAEKGQNSEGFPTVGDDYASRLYFKVCHLSNFTLQALEKLSSGYLKKWNFRRAARTDLVKLEEVEQSCSAGEADLLGRISRFWYDFWPKYESLGWDGSNGLDSAKRAELLQKFSRSYAGLVDSTERGAVVPANLDAISLPSVEPLPIEGISPRIAAIFEDWQARMLNPEPPTEKIRVYEDPLFRSRVGKLGLAKLLYKANMLRFVKTQRGPPVRCFTVVKKVVDGKTILRLIMDLRGTNAQFVSPPPCNMANAGSFAYVELSEEILAGGRLSAWGGDIPDFFYRLEIPSEMSEFFVLDGITAAVLCRELGLPKPPPGFNRLGMRVVCMGWNWAPYIAQTAAEDVIGSVPRFGLQAKSFDFKGLRPAPTSSASDRDRQLAERKYEFLKHGHMAPQFYDEAGRPCAFSRGLLYVYIDDFGGWVIERNDAALGSVARQDLAAGRDGMRGAGLGCHKEFIGLPDMLGYVVELTETPLSDGSPAKLEYFLKGQESKLFPLVAYTFHVLSAGRISPQSLSQLVGGFTWIILVNRPLLSVFSAVYAFINVYWNARYIEMTLWDSVDAELRALLGLLPFFSSSLSIPWAPYAYEVDAGPGKVAILRSPASVEELRVLGRLAERGGWLLLDESSDSPAAPDRVLSPDEIAARLFEGQEVVKPQEVGPEWFEPKRWVVLFVTALLRREHNTVSEVRAAVQAIRHFAKSPANWHSRLAILSDAFAAIGCLSKGRSCSGPCNALCRQAAAAIFVAELRVYMRWVASEHNCADGPSRGMRRPGVDPGTAAKARACPSHF